MTNASLAQASDIAIWAAIVVLAVAMDRLSQAFAAGRGGGRLGPGLWLLAGVALAALREAQAQIEAAAAADDDVAYGRGDSAFHEAFFSHSGNPYVVNSYALVSGKIAALRTNMARQFSNARDVSLQEHRAMVACVDAGDFAQLATILQAHVGRTVEAFRLASAAARDAAAAATAAAPALKLRSTD